MNILAGCFSVNGTCITSGSSASSTLLSDNNTFSGSLFASQGSAFSSFGTTSQQASAMVTFGDNNSATVPAVSFGGFNLTNWVSFGGGRGMVGYNGTADANLIVNSGSGKGIKFVVSGTSNNFDSGTPTIFLPSANAGQVLIGTTTPNNAGNNALFVTSTSTQSGSLPLFTVASSTGASLVSVNGNGQFGIGTTTPASALDVYGNITDEFVKGCNGATTALGTTATGTIYCETIASDQRIKNNIQSLDSNGELQKILKLNPISFQYNPAAGSQFYIPGNRLGLVAQQVQSVFPDVVSTSAPSPLTPNGTLTVDYSQLVSPLISAVQAQQKEINGLVGNQSGSNQWEFYLLAGVFGLYIVYNEWDKRRK